jgi:endonuclease/exonuclease/phosphatase (EEP) superfamily protein YafD
VFGSTQAFERTLAYARAEGADVIAFGETPLDAKVPKGIAETYRFRFNDSWRRSTSRLLILSKRPLGSKRDSYAPGSPKRSIYSVEVGGERHPLNLIVLHAFAPFTADWAKRRDAMLRHVSALPQGPFVIVGDLNATPWSSARFPICPAAPMARCSS